MAGLAVDASGNLYIGEVDSNRLRKVGLDGIITTVARLTSPYFLAFDAANNLFAAESSVHRVRKVSPDGTLTTVAGGGKPASGNGDGGPATSASLYWPFGLALDREDNLFIAEWGRSGPRVRRVSPDGTITTVAGTGTVGHSGDVGPATEARLSLPLGLATDAVGSLYIAEGGLDFGGIGSRVRRVNPEGIITTVAGTGPSGFSGDGGPATKVRLNWPFAVTVDSAGNLFIAEFTGRRVRKVSPDGTISTVAGGGTAIPSASGAPATSVALGHLTGIAVDAVGNLYIADSSAMGYGKRDWVSRCMGLRRRA